MKRLKYERNNFTELVCHLPAVSAFTNLGINRPFFGTVSKALVASLDKAGFGPRTFHVFVADFSRTFHVPGLLSGMLTYAASNQLDSLFNWIWILFWLHSPNSTQSKQTCSKLGIIWTRIVRLDSTQTRSYLDSFEPD